MKSRVPKHPYWRRERRRLPIVLSLLTVLGLSFGAAAIARAVDQPSPGRADVAAVAVAAPAQAAFATYNASITNGASQNDLYDWLTGRAGSIVHLVLSISKPVAADLKARPRYITMSSNCATASPPSNCARSLNLAGTRYLIHGDGAGVVTLANNVYRVDAYVAVDPVTLDRKGVYTMPLRIVDPNNSGDGEDD
jgi:hypothetical protein